MTHPQKHFDVIVTGAGPSGMMASLFAAEKGASVLLLEKKERPGKKLLLTGHGRCNITNIRIPDNFRDTYHENSRFLTSSLHAFPPEEVRELFLSLGIPTHEEDAGRIFPDSQKAASVCEALEKALEKKGIVLLTDSPVKSIEMHDGIWSVRTEKDTFESRAVILATGGKSFPHTGSEGDRKSVV